jgi:hypothetical protein
MVEEALAVLVTFTGRVILVAAWTIVLILAAFIVLHGLDVHGGSLVAADERLARAIASPFKFLNGIDLRQGWL